MMFVSFFAELALKEYKTRCGLRFRSVHKSSRHRQPIMKLSPEIISLLDGHYSGQAQVSCLHINLS